MISRNKDKDTEKAQAVAPAPAPAATSGGRRPNVRTAPSIISSDLVVHGNLTATGDIQIDGTVDGDIRSRVQLSSTCHVEGDILHEALAVETGAFFEGNCRHSDDPISQPSATQAQRPTAPRPAAAAPALGEAARPAAPRPAAPGTDSPVIVNDGGVVVKRPAAQ